MNFSIIDQAGNLLGDAVARSHFALQLASSVISVVGGCCAQATVPKSEVLNSSARVAHQLDEAGESRLFCFVMAESRIRNHEALGRPDRGALGPRQGAQPGGLRRDIMVR